MFGLPWPNAYFVTSIPPAQRHPPQSPKPAERRNGGLEMVAHRGVRTLAKEHGNFGELAPEDTAEALLMAAKMGLSVEFDVLALSGDARKGDRDRDDTDLLVIHHDIKTGRIFELPGKQRPVRKLTLKDWAKTRPSVAGNRQVLKHMYGETLDLSPAYLESAAPKAKPVIIDLLRQSDVRLYLEIKTDDDTRWRKANNYRYAHARKYNYPELKIARLFKELEAMGLDPYGRITLISFSPATLRLIKKLNPDIETGLSCEPPRIALKSPQKIRQYMDARAKDGISAICPPSKSVSNDFMRQAEAHHLKVLPWVEIQNRTAEASDFSRLAGLGVHGIMSNAPDLLLSHQYGEQAPVKFGAKRGNPFGDGNGTENRRAFMIH